MALNICVVNKEDYNSYPAIKKLGADHEFSVVHDDECPRGYAIFVFKDSVVVRNLITHKDMHYAR
jgi:hypothetical protein